MKRLNVKLLIWMIVISGVSLVSIIGLHQFQVKRNSGTYLKLADQAESNKEYGEAATFLSQYLQHHSDDAKQTARLALLLVDMAEKPDGGQVVLPAIGALQKALQLDESNSEARGRLAKLMVRINRVDDAVAQLEILRKQEPENAEWEKLLSGCRIYVGKYDEAMELLRSAMVHDPHDVMVYRQAAALLRQQFNDKEGMNQILDEMVAANPENADAFLVRYEFRRQDGQIEEAAPDLARALELKPTDITVLLAAAEKAVREQDWDKATEHLQAGVASHPEDYRTYLNLAQIERRQNRPAEAMAYIEQGIKAIPNSPDLKKALWESRLGAGDIPGAYQTIEEMQRLSVLPEFLEPMRAQTLMVDGKPMQALRILNTIRPRLTAAQFSIPVDLLRAQCYEALGQGDLQIEAYRQVLFNDQANRAARLGLANTMSRLGQVDEAVDELTALASAGDATAALSLFQIQMGQQMRLPAEQRDWTACDQLLQQLAEKLPDNYQLKAIQAEYLIHKEEYDAARELLTKLHESKPKELAPWLARIDLESQQNGLEAAQKELDAARAEVGDVPTLRAAQIGLWLRQGDEAAKKSLQEMAATVEQLPENERKPLRQQLANAFSLFGDRERAFKLYEQMAAESPNDLMSRLSAFRVAREAGDDVKMQNSLDQLKELVGPTNSYWQYGEAARIVSAVAAKKLPVADLDKARKLIEAAQAQRPNWGPLHSLLGEIEQRQGNIDAAITKYQRAFELGEQSANTVRSLVVLLVLRDRAVEAEAIVNSIPRAREILGPRVSAMIDLVLGRQKEGLEAAKQAAELAKDDYSTQLWYGNVMDRVGNFEEGEKAILRARDLADDVPDVWLALVNHYVNAKNLDAAKQVIAEAESKLPADRKERTLAPAYALVQEYDKAEPLYVVALEKNPDDLNLLRQVAAFYMETNKPQQMVDSLKTLLAKAGQAGTPGDAHGRWARRTLTQVLAASRSGADIRNAIKFLDSNNPQLKLDLDDMTLKANLLSLLNDGDSRRQAIDLLNDIVAQDPSRLQDQLTLAQLFNRSNDWASAKGTMLTVMKARPEDQNLLLAYAEMLLANNEQAEAEQYLQKYEQAEGPKLPAYTLIKARLLAMQDKPEEAIAAAKSVIEAPLTPDKVPQLKRIADMLTVFAQTASNPEPYYEAAGPMYRDYVKEVPDDRMVLAEFVGKHGDIDEALTICEESLGKETTESALRTALVVARARVSELTDARKQRIQGWFDKALKENPKDPMALLLLADFNDLQGKFQESADIYRTLLSNKELSGPIRATVLNNLSYLMAVKDNQGDEALPLIEEAITLVGPISELLDTRGMVQLSRGKTEEAVQDMRRSAGDNPTPLKLFHLALSLSSAGDEPAAAIAFKQAVEMGLKQDDVSSIERKSYDAMLARFPAEPAASE